MCAEECALLYPQNRENDKQMDQETTGEEVLKKHVELDLLSFAKTPHTVRLAKEARMLQLLVSQVTLIKHFPSLTFYYINDDGKSRRQSIILTDCNEG